MGQRTYLGRIAVTAALVAAVLAGCAEEMENQTELVTDEKPLAAYCMANVVGYGNVPTETDYLPRVIRCENGNADLEALKAQAVAARGYLYYKMSTSGSVAPDTSDQKYNCAGDPSPIHYQAVAETAGEYLEYNNTIVAAFYVAGAVPGNRQTCVAVPGDNDYSNTERYVTYNEGNSGSAVEQTTLGWVNSENWANRGCKSQNGAHCLAEAGWNYRDIITFYYGDDIQHLTAEGPCVDSVEPPTCGTTVAASGDTIIDDLDECFSNTCRLGDSWREESNGYAGHVWWTYAWDQPVDCTGEWALEFAQGGEYTVEVYLADIGNMTVQAPYTIRHNGQESEVIIAQEGGSGWTSLGDFSFAAGADQWVRLIDETGEPYVGESGPRIMFDAVRLTPTSTMPPMDDGPQDMGEGDTGNEDVTTDTADMGTTPDANVADGVIIDTPGMNDAGGDDPGGVIAQRTQSDGGCACRVSAPSSSGASNPLWAVLATMGALAFVRRLRQNRSDA